MLANFKSVKQYLPEELKDYIYTGKYKFSEDIDIESVPVLNDNKSSLELYGIKTVKQVIYTLYSSEQKQEVEFGGGYIHGETRLTDDCLIFNNAVVSNCILSDDCFISGFMIVQDTSLYNSVLDSKTTKLFRVFNSKIENSFIITDKRGITEIHQSTFSKICIMNKNRVVITSSKLTDGTISQIQENKQSRRNYIVINDSEINLSNHLLSMISESVDMHISKSRINIIKSNTIGDNDVIIMNTSLIVNEVSNMIIPHAILRQAPLANISNDITVSKNFTKTYLNVGNNFDMEILMYVAPSGKTITIIHKDFATYFHTNTEDLKRQVRYDLSDSILMEEICQIISDFEKCRSNYALKDTISEYDYRYMFNGQDAIDMTDTQIFFKQEILKTINAYVKVGYAFKHNDRYYRVKFINEYMSKEENSRKIIKCFCEEIAESIYAGIIG